MRRCGHALLLAVLLAASSVWADTIELKNGRIIDGKYLGGTSASIRFRDKAGKIALHRVRDVVAVSFGDLSEGVTPEAHTTPVPQSSTAPRQDTWSSTPRSSTSTSTSSSTSSSTAISSRDFVIPSGTTLRVRTIDNIDSGSAKVGDQFKASLAEDLVVDGTVIARRGADATLKLIQEEKAGTISGRGALTLSLTDLRVNDQVVSLAASEQVEGRSRSRQSAERIGGGAALGAAIGAIAGGGRGAAIGAIAGAGAGTAIQVLTRGDQVRVPSETVLEFHLEQPVTLRNFRTGAYR